MAKNAMPVSTAKTAYGLLSEVRRLILEEPRRYYQGDYIVSGDDAKKRHGADIPACGTVCCVAGWVFVLKGGFQSFTDNGRYVDDFATQVLFGSLDDASIAKAYELFDGDAAGSRSDIRRHAQRGAKHIVKFQKKYAKQLKAKRV